MLRIQKSLMEVLCRVTENNARYKMSDQWHIFGGFLCTFSRWMVVIWRRRVNLLWASLSTSLFPTCNVIAELLTCPSILGDYCANTLCFLGLVGECLSMVNTAIAFKDHVYYDKWSEIAFNYLAVYPSWSTPCTQFLGTTASQILPPFCLP